MEAIKHLKQSLPRTCGQTCVAMLAGKSEMDIVGLIGHAKGTKTKDIVGLLNTLNIRNSEKLTIIRSKTPLPEIAIIKAVPKRRKRTGGGWHWVLKYGEKVLDPMANKNLRKVRFTSFIAINQ